MFLYSRGLLIFFFSFVQPQKKEAQSKKRPYLRLFNGSFNLLSYSFHISFKPPPPHCQVQRPVLGFLIPRPPEKNNHWPGLVEAVLLRSYAPFRMAFAGLLLWFSSTFSHADCVPCFVSTVCLCFCLYLCLLLLCFLCLSIAYCLTGRWLP